MAVSFFLLARATKTLPLGTAYAVWTGIGALDSVIVGIILFKEPVTAGWLIFAALLLIGIHRFEDHVGLIHTITLPRQRVVQLLQILNEPSDVQSVDEPVVYLEREAEHVPLALAMIFAPGNARDGVVSVKIALIGQAL